MECEEALRSTYRALHDRDAVRDYWKRQFREISSRVDPESFSEEPDGALTLTVHQVVREAGSGKLLSDTRVRHRHWFGEDGLMRKYSAPREDRRYTPLCKECARA